MIPKLPVKQLSQTRRLVESAPSRSVTRSIELQKQVGQTSVQLAHERQRSATCRPAVVVEVGEQSVVEAGGRDLVADPRPHGRERLSGGDGLVDRHRPRHQARDERLAGGRRSVDEEAAVGELRQRDVVALR